MDNDENSRNHRDNNKIITNETSLKTDSKRNSNPVSSSDSSPTDIVLTNSRAIAISDESLNSHRLSYEKKVTPVRIEESKRQKLKSFLVKNILTPRQMDNLKDIGKELEDFGQSVDELEDGLTLTQCLAEINGTDSSDEEPDAQAIPISQQSHSRITAGSNNELHSATRHKSNTGNDTTPIKCQHEIKAKRAIFVAVEVKEEPVDYEDFESKHIGKQLVCEDGQQNLFDVNRRDEMTEKDGFQTPKMAGESGFDTKESSTIVKKKFRSIRKSKYVQKNKITDYFPKKSRNPTTSSTPKSAKSNTDIGFIVSALKGDPNRCVICNKDFTVGYLKTHYVDIHKIPKEDLIPSRLVKVEKVEDELVRENV